MTQAKAFPLILSLINFAIAPTTSRHVELSPTARDELHRAFDYISNEKQSPHNAANWLDGMRETVMGLASFPEANPLARENDEFAQELRQIVYKSHRVVYDISGDKVRVHHIIHTARDRILPEMDSPLERKQ